MVLLTFTGVNLQKLSTLFLALLSGPSVWDPPPTSQSFLFSSLSFIVALVSTFPSYAEFFSHRNSSVLDWHSAQATRSPRWMGCPNEDAYLSGMAVCSRLQICAADGCPFARSRAVTALLREFSIFLHGDLYGFSNGMAFKEQRRSCDRCILGVSGSGSQRAQDNSLAESECSVTSWPLSVCCHVKLHCRNTQSGIMQNHLIYVRFPRCSFTLLLF